MAFGLRKLLLLAALLFGSQLQAQEANDPALILDKAVATIDDQLEGFEEALKDGAKELSDEEAEAMKETTATLRKQLTDAQNRLKAIEKQLGGKQAGAKAGRKPAIDPLPFGSNWDGKFWVRDTNNAVLHEGVASGKITQRDQLKSDFQLTVELEPGHVWEYKFKKSKGEFVIDEANQASVQIGSREAPGKVSIRQSAAKYQNKTLQIDITRPVAGQMRVVRYELTRKLR